MMGVEFVLAALLGLYGNRVRGGLYALPGGDLPARVLGSLIGFGAVAALAGLGWCSLLVALAALIGDMIAGADGEYGTIWIVAAFIRMWLYGFERLALVAVVLVGVDLWRSVSSITVAWLTVAWLACPVVYALAPYWPVAIPWLGMEARNGDDSGFGEAVWGAVCGLALMAALVPFSA